MTFSGYVQLRRGLLEHLQDGRLSLLEYAVLVGLILLASKETGSGTINANTLGAFMGEGLDYESEVPRNRQRGKQRLLRNLQTKGYIYRQIVPHSKRAYRFWVNKYLITDGPNKSRRLDLSQVFKSQDINDIRYVGTVAESVAGGVAETVASNKKEKETRENFPTPVSASREDNSTMSSSRQRQETQSPKLIGVNASRECVIENASLGMRHVYDAQPRRPLRRGDLSGLRFYDPANGKEITQGEALAMDAAYLASQKGNECQYLNE